MNTTQFIGNYRTKKILLRLLTMTCVMTGIIALTAGRAAAFGSYTTSFNTEYGTAGTSGGSTLGSCITCHRNSNGTGGYNSYGNDWKNNSKSYRL